ncbi:MAG: right-handed parallel beta-helix repeat-containing protein [Phycisphaerae bacterium]|nr:right-handed parallel beta-helix repeat-containing protein [Phycisphaerae bacterium]
MRKATHWAVMVLVFGVQYAGGATHNMTLYYFDWQEPGTLVKTSTCKIYYQAELNPAYYATCYYNVKIYLSSDATLDKASDFLFHVHEEVLYGNSYWGPKQQNLAPPAGGWALPANGFYYVFMEIERGRLAPPDTNVTDNIYMFPFRITVDSGILPQATISGYVRTAGGQGISGVTLYGLPGAPVTNAQGFYTAAMVLGESGTAVPSAPCFSFTPGSRSYINVQSNQINQNYTAGVRQPRISGTVRLPSGKAVAGTRIQIGEGGPVVTTDLQGYYETHVGCPWSGDITPQKEGYRFSPGVKGLSGLVSDHVQDFTAARDGSIYVDPTAGGVYDGSSWENAFIHLQDALLEAGPGNDIYVAGAVYRPDQGGMSESGDRRATFRLHEGVGLYGGFPSGGGDWSERDFEQHATVLSGDLRYNDGPGRTNRGDNAFHVVTGGNGATLDGFIIIGGNADAAGDPNSSRGGGMYNSESGVTVRNCIFVDNYAYKSGGAIHTVSAAAGNGLALRLEQCTFTDNTAQRGGAVYTEQMGQVTMEGCYFSGANIAAGDMPYFGGAAYNLNCGEVRVVGCMFRDNAADTEGGGLKNESVGSVVLRSCVFFNNTTIYSSGSGVHNKNSNCTAINCTFARNAATHYPTGAGIGSSSGSLKVTNCIFWRNTGNGIATQAAQVYASPQAADMNYCCVQGLAAGAAGVGNFKTDPNFVDLDGGDLHLNLESPCVNKGNPNGNYADLYDIDGDRRVRYGRVDIGADEYVSMPGDFQPDGRVDFADMAMLAAYWRKECGAGWCGDTDIDQSGSIGAADLAALADHWLNTGP